MVSNRLSYYWCILILVLGSGGLWGQTKLTTPVIILPTADGTTTGTLAWRDLGGRTLTLHVGTLASNLSETLPTQDAIGALVNDGSGTWSWDPTVLVKNGFIVNNCTALASCSAGTAAAGMQFEYSPSLVGGTGLILGYNSTGTAPGRLQIEANLLILSGGAAIMGLPPYSMQIGDLIGGQSGIIFGAKLEPEAANYVDLGDSVFPFRHQWLAAMDFVPVTTSPTPGHTCYDEFGNIAAQPSMPSNSTDIIAWNSTSPLRGYYGWPVVGGINYYQLGTACAAPLAPPSGMLNGLNIDSYLFTFGYATSTKSFNAIEVFHGGGVVAQGLEAVGVYPPGTQVRTGFAPNPYDHYNTVDSSYRTSNSYGSYLGGYVWTGYSDDNPGGSTGTCTSIAVCDNPLISGVGLGPGLISYNTTAGADGNGSEVVYDGTAWRAFALQARGVSFTGLQVTTGNFQVDSSGNVSAAGSYNATGIAGSASGFNVTVNTAYNSIQTAGGFKAAGTSVSGYSFTVGSVAAIDNSGNFTGAGVDVAGSATNVIQAPNGGVTGEWLIATDSVFWIQEAAPALPSSGQSKIYMDSTSHTLKVSQNGAAFVDLMSSSGVTSLTGTPNEISVSSSTGAITLSTPQDIATTSTPYFNGVVATGTTPAFNSAAMGATIAFQTSNTNFQINGDGVISIGGASAALNVGGVATIDARRNIYVASIILGGLTTIDSSRNGTLNALTTYGAINSVVTGTAIAFQLNNNNFAIDGNGNYSGVGQMRALGHWMGQGAPTVSLTCTGSSCGVSQCTGYGSPTSTDTRGCIVTTGISTSTIAISFANAYSSAPTCMVSIGYGASGEVMPNYTVSTSSIQLSWLTPTPYGSVVTYLCVQ